MKTASRPCGKVKQYGQGRDFGNAEPYQSLQEGKNMYHDFESYTITRRSFLKGAGAVGAAGLLAACGGSSSGTAASASSASSGAAGAGSG